MEVGEGFHQPLRWPGHYYDDEIGLCYNRFRYYDPELGRYIQADPLGLGGGLNVYAYTDNPLRQVDLLGLGCPEVIRHVLVHLDGSKTIVEIAPVPGRIPGEHTVSLGVTLEPDSRPPYRPNPAHDPGSPHYNPRKTPEPSDARSVYEGALLDSERGAYYGLGENAEIYRFFPDNNGGAHFSGMTGDGGIREENVPIDIRRSLRSNQK